jgi:hypothetical protein
MKRFWAVLVCLVFFAWGAEAATISSLYGDMDGFGLGFQAGQTFKANGKFAGGLQANRSQDDAATVTDAFGHQDDDGQVSWRQWTMGLTAEEIRDLDQMVPASISLKMLTGAGPRFYRDSILYLDTDPGDSENWMIAGRFSAPYKHRKAKLYVREDTFDLISLQEWILPCLRSSGLSFKIETQAGPSSLSFAGWVMDYSALTVTGDRTAIPEAATLWLLAGGLVILLVIRRRHAA